MKVFISSVIAGFEAEREAAASGVRALRHDVIRAEDFGARAETPQQACLDGVRQADVVLLLLGSRYGTRQAPSGLSATEEEFVEAARTKPVLAFTQEGVERDADMVEFVRRVEEWAGGALSARFRTNEELRDAVVYAMSEFALAQQAGRVDPSELRDRALEALPVASHGLGSEPLLVLAVAGGPTQQILRPAEIEDSTLCQAIKQAGMFGDAAVLNSERGGRCRISNGALLVGNNDVESISLDPCGTVFVAQSARATTREISGLNPIIEEDVAEGIERALRFAAWLLDHVDPTMRLREVAPVVTIVGSPMGWQTRAEHAASPNAMTIGFGSERAAITLSPPTRPRRALLSQALDLAKDFTVLLRRQARR